MFLYRENEIELLENDFIKPKSTLSIIFGRRKVGKTSLLNYYIKDKKALYLNAYETMQNILFNNFKKSTDDFFGISNSDSISSLEEFCAYLSKQNIDSKVVIILENVQNLLKLDKNFFVKFYSYWNKYLKSKNIQLIITSAILSSVKEDMAVFNKFENQIKLKALNFNIIKNIFPNMDKNTSMYVYAAFGTNPQYLALYDDNKDFILNIKDNFLSYDNFIYTEGISIIKNDLSDVITYCSILYAISMGNKKIGDIASFLDLKSSYLTRYLQKLVDLMIINKEIPLNDNPNKSKFGRYEIDDNFLKFWFCYIYPNQDYLNKKDYYPIIKHIREDFSKRLVNVAYSKYVKELVSIEPEKFFLFTPKKIGSWWNNKDVEIDLIAYNGKFITFIDCIWRKNNHMKENYDFLQAKSKYFETTLIKKYIIFSKNSK